MYCKSSIAVATLFALSIPSTTTSTRAQDIAPPSSTPSTTDHSGSSTHIHALPIHNARRRNSTNDLKAAERRGFKRVSDLTNFPRFFPSLGFVFVKPATLPTGPFLSFDRQNRLVATTYMLSLKEMNEHKKFEMSGMTKPVNHTTVYYNGGHPGVMMPHYHVVAWHISKAAEARVAK